MPPSHGPTSFQYMEGDMHNRKGRGREGRREGEREGERESKKKDLDTISMKNGGKAYLSDL